MLANADFACGLVRVLIFFRNIVFRNLPGANFGYFSVTRFLNASDHLSLGGITFFEQFLDTLRVCLRPTLYSLRIAGLSS